MVRPRRRQGYAQSRDTRRTPRGASCALSGTSGLCSDGDSLLWLLDDDVADMLTRVLFERRRELMNLTSLAGFISPPNFGGGTYIPVHPGAQRFYDRDRPSFIQENAEPIALLVTLAALMISGLFQLGSRRRKRRIDLYNKEVLDLGRRV